MSLTYKQIWERYSHLIVKRKLYIKRLSIDGTYESEWQEISQGMTKDGSVNSISRSLPNNSYSFGEIEVGNVSMQIVSAFQEFASENDPNSIFSGYIRHKSKFRVLDILVDKYTDPLNPEEIAVTTFEGLIDASTAQTEQGFEKLTVLDYLSVLNDVNVSELSISSTTINQIVFEAINRPEFTKFFNVSSSSTYINAGYNASSVDVSVYTGSVLDMLKDLAKGHSVFYINEDDGYFYFKSAEPSSTEQHQFLEENNRKIDISAWREGIDRQITKWYWDDDSVSISSLAEEQPVNPISKNFKIEGITNNTQRKNVLDAVLSKTKFAKPYFKLTLPYYPVIKLFDRVSVQSFGSAPKDALRWGMFKWTSSATTSPNIAPKWRKPGGIRISAEDEWMVRKILHSSGWKTEIELEKIL